MMAELDATLGGGKAEQEHPMWRERSKDAEMITLCGRGRSLRRCLSTIVIGFAGFISLMIMLQADISIPSLRIMSKNVGSRIDSSRKNQQILLESSEVRVHRHGPPADDYYGVPRRVAISENRFHYKPRRKEKVTTPYSRTKSLAEDATEFGRLLKTDATVIKIEKPFSKLENGLNVFNASDTRSEKTLASARKPHVFRPEVGGHIHTPSQRTEKSNSKSKNGTKTYHNLDTGSEKQPTAAIKQHKASGYSNYLDQKKSVTPRRYLKDPEGFERYKKYLSMKEQPLPEQHNAVVILTNHRSGSSFFGELFNQHPDAFSLFEPLFPLSNRSECNKNIELKIELLKDFVRCKMPNWMEVYKKIPPAQRVKINDNLRTCISKGVCFPMHTKELCEDRHCPRTRNESVRNCVIDCGRLNVPLVENDCRRKKVVVAKLIRFCDILDLESVLKTEGSNIKVLHLLRDPRGIANSRHVIEKRLNLKESLSQTCKRQFHNLLTGVSETPEWLKGKYMAIRYEDAALYPYETAQSVYDFVGLNFPNIIKDWIASNTAIHVPDNSTSASDSARKTLSSHYKIPKHLDPYSTRRNATATVQKWAKHLPYPTVLEVESVCLDIMKIAGYINAGTVDQYHESNRMFFKHDIPILA